MLIPTFTGTVLDQDGTPLSGGWIAVTVNDALINLFADAQCTVGLPNPVPLDSLGIAPALFTTSTTALTCTVLKPDRTELYQETFTPEPAAFTEVAVFQRQQLNHAGEPNSEGRIYTYIQGSFSIEAATFADSSGSVQNDNPLILDKNGFAPNSFFVPSGSCINFLLTDKNGTPLTTLDSART